jgi:malate dehydrogenase (oxaloacetate-decarboxylating)
MPDVAKRAGVFIMATGRSDFPNQVNNVLAFPGIFRGALDHGVLQFTDTMFVAAAEALAACVESPSSEKILSGPFEPGISAAVAEAIRN